MKKNDLENLRPFSFLTYALKVDIFDRNDDLESGKSVNIRLNAR